MSISQPHRYKLYISSYWNKDYEEYKCELMMSAMPSRDDVIAVLRNLKELENYSSEYIGDLVVERPSGWYYKTILVYNKKNSQNLWKMVPAP